MKKIGEISMTRVHGSTSSTILAHSSLSFSPATATILNDLKHS